MHGRTNEQTDGHNTTTIARWPLASGATNEICEDFLSIYAVLLFVSKFANCVCNLEKSIYLQTSCSNISREVLGLLIKSKRLANQIPMYTSKRLQRLLHVLEM